MKPDKELIGASTALLVLTVLSQEASYGYHIIRTINLEADGLYTWQEGTIYPVLHKLEKDCMVRTQWQEADTGRRRKYYYITSKGRGAIGSGVKQWEAFNGLIARMADQSHG